MVPNGIPAITLYRVCGIEHLLFQYSVDFIAASKPLFAAVGVGCMMFETIFIFLFPQTFDYLWLRRFRERKRTYFPQVETLPLP